MLVQSQGIVPMGRRLKEELSRVVGLKAMHDSAVRCALTPGMQSFKHLHERSAQAIDKSSLLALSDVLGPGGREKVMPMLEQVRHKG
jgi:hypothetical protein